MRNRLYDYICVFVLLEILQPSIYYAKVINDIGRTKREISVPGISQPKGKANYAKEVQGRNLMRKEKVDDDLENDTYFRERRKRSANTDLQRSNAGKLIDYDDTISQLGSKEESDYTEETDEDAVKEEQDKDEESGNLVRLSRDVNADLDKYTDQDERSGLYDDYEAKDVAKRGVLGGPGDYEEVEEDLPGVFEDTVAIEEQESMANEAERRETRNDARVKRDQAISETLDKSKSSANVDPAKLKEPRDAAEEEASASNDVSKIKGSGSNEATSRLSDSTQEIKEPASVAASSKKDESNVEYERRVEDEIQRKIDSIKEEIKRDVETQQRIRDIEENNARFDEQQDREREEEQSFEGETIEKRQTAVKRSIREVADDAAVSSRRNEKKSLKGEQRKKLQRRSSETGRSDTLKESENPKRRFVTKLNRSSERNPSKGLFKKKRERVRQTFPMNNDRANRRRSRSYAKNGLSIDPKPNSHLQTNDKTLQESSSVAGEDTNNEEERNRATAENLDSLVSLTGSSQELNPRLAKEYKEAFGGLQSEPGSALARFKRIKRVLDGSNAKI